MRRPTGFTPCERKGPEGTCTDPPIGAVTDVSGAIWAGAQIRPLYVTRPVGHAEVLKNVRNGCLTWLGYLSEEEG
jgi:hypothetical protein